MAQKIQALGPSDRSGFASCVGDASPDTPSDTSTPETPMAEREGFEPPMGLHPCRISSAVHSTTLPPLRGRDRPLPARRSR